MVKIDLRKAYHVIKVDPRYTKYLKFQWKGQLWEYCTMPLGISSAPRIYNAIMGALVMHLRKMGIRMAYFVDNVLVMGRTKLEAETQAKTVIS
jgi:hypothetical protein